MEHIQIHKHNIYTIHVHIYVYAPEDIIRICLETESYLSKPLDPDSRQSNSSERFGMNTKRHEMLSSDQLFVQINFCEITTKYCSRVLKIISSANIK